jgi:hypothetical protein
VGLLAWPGIQAGEGGAQGRRGAGQGRAGQGRAGQGRALPLLRTALGAARNAEVAEGLCRAARALQAAGRTPSRRPLPGSPGPRRPQLPAAQPIPTHPTHPPPPAPQNLESVIKERNIDEYITREAAEPLAVGSAPLQGGAGGGGQPRPGRASPRLGRGAPRPLAGLPILAAEGAPARAVRCGAVRCSAVQCGAVRCGAVRCGAVRCGAVRCGAVQCSRRRAPPRPADPARNLPQA